MLQYKFELKIKGIDTVFKDGLGKGVFSEMVATWEDANENDKDNLLFVKSVMETQDKFIEDNIEVIITPYVETLTYDAITTLSNKGEFVYNYFITIRLVEMFCLHTLKSAAV